MIYSGAIPVPCTTVGARESSEKLSSMNKTNKYGINILNLHKLTLKTKVNCGIINYQKR